MPPTPTELIKNFFKYDPKYFYYFAYGSNLLKERLHVLNPTAEFVQVGFIRGYSLGFYAFSSVWHGAYATVYPDHDENSKVFGCVWRLSTLDSDSLDLQENLYRRFDVDVQIPHESNGLVNCPNESNDVINCRTYVIMDLDRFVPDRDLPSPHYKHVIVSGALEHGLPKDYVNRLKSVRDNGYVGPVPLKLKALTFLNS